MEEEEDPTSVDFMHAELVLSHFVALRLAGHHSNALSRQYWRAMRDYRSFFFRPPSP